MTIQALGVDGVCVYSHFACVAIAVWTILTIYYIHLTAIDCVVNKAYPYSSTTFHLLCVDKASHFVLPLKVLESVTTLTLVGRRISDIKPWRALTQCDIDINGILEKVFGYI